MHKTKAILYDIGLCSSCSLDLWVPRIVLHFQHRRKDEEKISETTKYLCACVCDLAPFSKICVHVICVVQ